jgi:uncharacterized Fe-S cluster-containing radical SAM superfamily protein
MRTIDTVRLSKHLRARSIDKGRKRLLITKFHGSLQAKDFSEPINCNGFGRIRHFSIAPSKRWPTDPLPIVPATKALHCPPVHTMRAQVFQNAACNWRCWYCFVDFDLLSANPKRADFLTCAELVDLYLNEESRPSIIDLSGGQPDLVPEWVPWMMLALRAKRLENHVYLWSDDNLSTDYFWRYLTRKEIRIVREYPKYGRVGCFKGFDHDSFAFNTNARPEAYDLQFEFASRLAQLGIDLYFYTNFTCANLSNLSARMHEFVDRLQRIGESVPLRTVPLEICSFTPVEPRMNAARHEALENQYAVVECWTNELSRRFTSEELGSCHHGELC